MLLDLERSLSTDDVRTFYPQLIRILPDNISESRTVRLPAAGMSLAVTYLAADEGWAGHLIYMMSSELEGELQLLTYEGLELPYLTHFEEAMASLQSFRDDKLIPR